MAEQRMLTNHEIIITLAGGAVLGPFRATWSTEIKSDVRELTRDYDAFLNGQVQTRFKYHLHDYAQNLSHSLVLRFENVTAIYDRVELREDHSHRPAV